MNSKNKSNRHSIRNKRRIRKYGSRFLFPTLSSVWGPGVSSVSGPGVSSVSGSKVSSVGDSGGGRTFVLKRMIRVAKKGFPSG